MRRRAGAEIWLGTDLPAPPLGASPAGGAGLVRPADVGHLRKGGEVASRRAARLLLAGLC